MGEETVALYYAAIWPVSAMGISETNAAIELIEVNLEKRREVCAAAALAAAPQSGALSRHDHPEPTASR